MRRLLLSVVALSFLSVPAFAGPAEQRSEIQSETQKTLERLYKEEPGTRDEIATAEGYAVMANGGLKLIVISAGYGKGLTHDNKTGKDTYMEMATGGVGLGLGIKDYRLVFVFKTREALNHFITDGWDFSGEADATAKAGAEGGEASGAVDAIPGVRVYQLTEAGLSLQATLQGTKYWADDELNH